MIVTQGEHLRTVTMKPGEALAIYCTQDQEFEPIFR
jgi:hypothetical protein